MTKKPPKADPAVFTFRLQPRDTDRMESILDRDGEVDNRTGAVRAALAHYDRYLRRREKRSA